MIHPTKEELVDIMGIGELFSERLNDIGYESDAAIIETITERVRFAFNEMCGEEELKRIREHGIKD